ncbi:hypothetical protein DFH27DRAFT_607762 [Peziza echinospora]|nr:hypothetical protein DFH27DRAFT_607762 [Peziza echinospora]
MRALENRRLTEIKQSEKQKNSKSRSVDARNQSSAGEMPQHHQHSSVVSNEVDQNSGTMNIDPQLDQHKVKLETGEQDEMMDEVMGEDSKDDGLGTYTLPAGLHTEDDIKAYLEEQLDRLDGLVTPEIRKWEASHDHPKPDISKIRANQAAHENFSIQEYGAAEMTFSYHGQPQARNLEFNSQNVEARASIYQGPLIQHQGFNHNQIIPNTPGVNNYNFNVYGPSNMGHGVPTPAPLFQLPLDSSAYQNPPASNLNIAFAPTPLPGFPAESQSFGEPVMDSRFYTACHPGMALAPRLFLNPSSGEPTAIGNETGWIQSNYNIQNPGQHHGPYVRSMNDMNNIHNMTMLPVPVQNFPAIGSASTDQNPLHYNQIQQPGKHSL